MRWSAIFTIGCMVVTAGALGAAAYLVFGLTSGQAGAAILAILAVLAVIGVRSRSKREPETASRQVADLSRGTTDLARQVGDLGRRVMALEALLAKQDERVGVMAEQNAQAVVAPMSAEIEVLGTLVKQLADSVAAHEVALLNSFAQAGERDFAARPRSEPHNPQPAATRPEPAPEPASFDPEMLRKVRAALEANRIDLYLQPIVTLPQRKVRYYEAVTRLRTEDGAVLTPADYLRPAEIGGLMPLLDNLMLFRCVQVVRRLSSKNRELGLFCNIAISTLLDGEFFPQFQDFLANNRALASSLIFELPQQSLRGLGPIERASLSQLAALGFRFSMDRVSDLQIDPRALAEEGFRYVKIPAEVLLDQEASAAANIHASDLSKLMARYGIELIAERIENESTVVDLLDFDVKFAQGFLFAPPRPVRSEVFQGAAERSPVAESVDHSSREQESDLAELPSVQEAAARIPTGLLQLARKTASGRGG
jgi:cyclic-di-GMP phosphodiesterase TipF (flagellum assembly factor)